MPSCTETLLHPDRVKEGKPGSILLMHQTEEKLAHPAVRLVTVGALVPVDVPFQARHVEGQLEDLER